MDFTILQKSIKSILIDFLGNELISFNFFQNTFNPL